MYVYYSIVFTITGPNGVITSPGYPEAYPTDIESGWLIQLPPGQLIEVYFSSIDIYIWSDDPLCK